MTADTTTGRILCSKHVSVPCTSEAVELLLVRGPDSMAWHARPRCGLHPAADDIPLLRHITPGIEHVIVPLGAGVRTGS